MWLSELVRNPLTAIIKYRRRATYLVVLQFYHVLITFKQTENAVREKAANMIRKIHAQEETILRELHQRREQELGHVLTKLDSVDSYLQNAQRLKVSTFTCCSFGTI